MLKYNVVQTSLAMSVEGFDHLNHILCQSQILEVDRWIPVRIVPDKSCNLQMFGVQQYLRHTSAMKCKYTCIKSNGAR